MPLEYVDDLTPAQWIAERLHPFARDAGAIIPPGFDAYARIFHPATRRVGQAEVPVTWREIADANLRVHHAQMQFGALVTRVGMPSGARQPQPGLFDSWPKTGSLPLDLARVLVALLRGHTSTPDVCWFAAWEGWGDPVSPDIRRVEGQSRSAADHGYRQAEAAHVQRTRPRLLHRPWSTCVRARHGLRHCVALPVSESLVAR
jgi:hypothetical protein